MDIKPIIKWAGGKTQLLPRLRARLPASESIDWFCEPFAGGAALALSERPAKLWLNDANQHLMHLYEAVRDDCDALLAAVREIANTSEAFYEIRRLFNEGGLSPLHDAALFWYLNKACFRGIYRENKSGGFNVPYGNYASLHFDEDNTRAMSTYFHKCELRLTCGGFEQVFVELTEDDFVYADPPYYPMTATQFTTYTKSGFGDEHQTALIRELRATPARWILSQSPAGFVRSGMRGFEQESFRGRRAVNVKQGGGEGGGDNELLVYKT